MREMLASVSDLFNLLSTLGIIGAIKESSIWIAGMVSLVCLAIVVTRVSMTGWKVAKWSGRTSRRAMISAYRWVRPIPEPEPILSGPCQSVLSDLDDPDAMIEERTNMPSGDPKLAPTGMLLVAGPLKVWLESEDTVAMICKDATDAYNVLLDMPANEVEAIEEKVLATKVRVRERDRQNRLATFSRADRIVTGTPSRMSASWKPSKSA